MNNKLETDIFYKSTNNFAFVPFDSFHPSHIKRNVPYILFSRINRIVSNEEIKYKRFLEIANVLYNLKYPQLLIQDAFNKSLCYILKSKSICNSEDILPFVIKFNKTNVQVAQSVSNNYKFLQNNTETPSIFNNTKLQISYKNNNNIIRSLNKPLERVENVPLIVVVRAPN